MLSGTLGIIGYGNMGAAIVRGLIGSGMCEAKDVYVAEIDPEKAEAAKRDGCKLLESAVEVGRSVSTVIVAVKPNVAMKVFGELNTSPSRTLVVSIVAGIPTNRIEKEITSRPVVRVMPNTPCLVGAGASAVCRGSNAGNNHVELVMEIMGALGEVIEVPESQMDAVTGLSGSGPAYVAIMIDALTDGGVLMGLPRPTAHKLAVQTVFGSAKIILDRGIAPSVLRDMVTSPGGTTIEGISALEARAFRAALIEAVEAAALKSEELGS